MLPADAGSIPPKLDSELSAILTDTSIPVGLRLARLRQAANERLGKSLEKAIAALESMADGVESTEETYVPKHLVMVGNQRVYPNAPENELILVRKVVKKGQPDRVAVQYIMDRLLGTIAQNINVQSTSLIVSVDGQQLKEASDADLARLYHEKVRASTGS